MKFVKQNLKNKNPKQKSRKGIFKRKIHKKQKYNETTKKNQQQKSPKIKQNQKQKI